MSCSPMKLKPRIEIGFEWILTHLASYKPLQSLSDRGVLLLQWISFSVNKTHHLKGFF